MTKNDSEKRTGLLLQAEHFIYYYKPVDSPGHGGAVRIDFFACDKAGLFWMVEVKSVDEGAKSINLMNDVSPLQRRALDSITRSIAGNSLLIVWQKDLAWVWKWRRVVHVWEQRKQSGEPKPELLPLKTASAVLHWTGESKWQPSLSTAPQFHNLDLSPYGSAMIPIVYSPLLPSQGVSLGMLKRAGYTLTRGRMLPLERSSSSRTAKDSSSASTRTGGMKPSPTKTRKRLARI